MFAMVPVTCFQLKTRHRSPLQVEPTVGANFPNENKSPMAATGTAEFEEMSCFCFIELPIEKFAAHF